MRTLTHTIASTRTRLGIFFFFFPIPPSRPVYSSPSSSRKKRRIPRTLQTNRKKKKYVTNVSAVRYKVPTRVRYYCSAGVWRVWHGRGRRDVSRSSGPRDDRQTEITAASPRRRIAGLLRAVGSPTRTARARRRWRHRCRGIISSA